MTGAVTGDRQGHRHVVENVPEARQRVAQQFGQMALVCPSSVEVVSLMVVNEGHERNDTILEDDIIL